MTRVLVLVSILCATALFATACGSSKKTEPTVSLPRLQPPARTPDEWAQRIVDRFLRPMNADLMVVNGFNNPDILVFIANQNPTTLRIVRTRLVDLAKCSGRLVAIGPPPAGRRPLRRISTTLQKACVNYVRLVPLLQKATLDISSGRTDVVAEGRKVLHSAIPIANSAGQEYAAAVKIAQRLPEFRRAGLQPSV